MSALDAIGPYEVLRCVPGVRVRFVAKRPRLVKTDSGLQMLNAEHGMDNHRHTETRAMGTMIDRTSLAPVRHAAARAGQAL